MLLSRAPAKLADGGEGANDILIYYILVYMYSNIVCVSRLIRSFAPNLLAVNFSPKPMLFFNQFLLLLIITLFESA
jgi:hypothetical protein